MLQRIITRTLSPRAVTAIGALVVSPSVAAGLAMDDYVQRLHARGYAPLGHAARLDMFRFMDPAQIVTLRERGIVPWFAADHLRVGFFRPLSALFHVLDYAVLRLPPWAMHVESIAWYALLVFSAARLYGRMIASPGVAGLAGLLYAVDSGHGLPAGWIANRNAVIASVFAVLAITAHDRWRRDRWRPGAVVSAVCFALALAGGEMGVGAMAYLVAYACTMDRGPWWSRAATLVPAASVLVAWQIVYRAGGYGASGSAFYTDPATSPLRFAGYFFVRAPQLVFGELALFPVELAPRALLAGVVAALGVVAFAALAWAAWPLVRRDPRARFFALGALLALGPIAGVMPATRVMMLFSVGVLGLLALLVANVTATRGGKFVRVCAGLHVVVSPILLVVYVLSPLGISQVLAASGRGLPRPEELAQTDLVLVRTPSSLGAVYRFVVPENEPFVGPRTMRYGATGTGDCVVTRLDPQTLEIDVDAGLLNDPFASLFRDTNLHTGDRVALSDMDIEIVAESNGVVRAARFRFSGDMERSDRLWIAWDHGAFVRFSVPAIGHSVTLHD